MAVFFLSALAAIIFSMFGLRNIAFSFLGAMYVAFIAMGPCAIMQLVGNMAGDYDD
jgi:hypothetical protein